jgi:hypothetical protein
MPSSAGLSSAIQYADAESACELHPCYFPPRPRLNWHVHRLHPGRRAMFEHGHRAGSAHIETGQPQRVAEMAGDIALGDFPSVFGRETTKAEHRRPSDDIPSASAERRPFSLRSCAIAAVGHHWWLRWTLARLVRIPVRFPARPATIPASQRPSISRPLRSAGELESTAPPSSANLALSLGSARLALISLLSLWMISTGVFLGAPTSAQ